MLLCLTKENFIITIFKVFVRLPLDDGCDLYNQAFNSSFHEKGAVSGTAMVADECCNDFFIYAIFDRIKNSFENQS